MSTSFVSIAPSSVNLSPSTIPVTANLSDEEDRISALPDHILLNILERLNDLRAAIQAGTLSKRWVHLPLSLSRLLVDIADFLPRDRGRREHWTVDEVMATYTATLTRLLRHSSSGGLAIKDMQLSFYLTDPYLNSIGHALSDIMECGRTDCLEFTIWVDTHQPSYEQCVLFKERLMGFLHACPTTFSWLTRLILQYIIFGDTDVSNLLNNCNKLEFLSLTYCDTAFDLVTGEDTALTINAPHSALLALEIHNCGFTWIDLIQAPKLGRLLCLNWIGMNPPLRFGDVPCLDNIALRCAASHGQTPFVLSHWLTNTTTLSTLYLDFVGHMIWIEPEGPLHLSLIFSNLRDVYLHNIFYECDLNWTMFILEAAPSLNNLYLKLFRHHCESYRFEDSAKKVNMLWDQASLDLKHNQLSLVEIVGFAVDEKLMKYIRLVMQRAVVLKRICLLDQPPCDECDAMDRAQSPSLMRWRFPIEEEEKKLVKQQLLDGFSSSVEISIG